MRCVSEKSDCPKLIPEERMEVMSWPAYWGLATQAPEIGLQIPTYPQPLEF